MTFAHVFKYTRTNELLPEIPEQKLPAAAVVGGEVQPDANPVIDTNSSTMGNAREELVAEAVPPAREEFARGGATEANQLAAEIDQPTGDAAEPPHELI